MSQRCATWPGAAPSSAVTGAVYTYSHCCLKRLNTARASASSSSPRNPAVVAHQQADELTEKMPHRACDRLPPSAPAPNRETPTSTVRRRSRPSLQCSDQILRRLCQLASSAALAGAVRRKSGSRKRQVATRIQRQFLLVTRFTTAASARIEPTSWTASRLLIANFWQRRSVLPSAAAATSTKQQQQQLRWGSETRWRTRSRMRIGAGTRWPESTPD